MNSKIKAVHYLEYYALKSAMAFIYLLGQKAAFVFGDFVSYLIYYFIPIRKKHILQSLALSFPEKTDGQIREIAKNTYKNFSRTIIEIMFFAKFDGQTLKNLMTIENEDAAEKAFQNGKGAVFMSAHFGNWELTALSFSQRHPMSVLVAKQANPLIDKLMNSVRTRQNGYKTISRDGNPYREVLKALKRNEFVAVLSDQDGGRQGCFAEFFGRPASTPKGAAVFALRSGCPLITAFGVRQPDGSTKTYLEEIPAPNTADAEKDVEIICAKYSEKLEYFVRQYPEQWFWFHKKWKTKQQIKEN
jgi:KDO2-lipid IV(A) lauroyltransferase